MKRTKVTLTLKSQDVRGGDQMETYWVNAKLGNALQSIQDGGDIIIRDEQGNEFIEHKYCLDRAWQDESGKWFARFWIEEWATEESFAGLIRADCSIALGQLEEVDVNWRGC